MDKKILITCLTIITSFLTINAFSQVSYDENYGYFGLMAGYAQGSNQVTTNVGHGVTVLDVSNKNQYGGRIFGGYQVNKYIGLEVGGGVISSYDLTVDTGQFGIQHPNTFFGWLDAVLKVGYVTPKFGVYAKGGVALTYTSFDINVNDDLVITNGNGNGNCNGTNNCNGNDNGNGTGDDVIIIDDDNDGDPDAVDNVQTESKTRSCPIISLGASYNLTPNWVVDLSWSRIYNNTFVKNIDFVALGLSYRFVNVFCGQFLCND